MKRVFKYMGWPWDRPGFTPSKYKPDGRDMVLCINAMRDKGDWSKYVFYVSTYYYSNSCFFFEDITFSVFGDPAKFFELMEAWREEVEKNEKAD